MKYSTFNARVETIAKAPSFRDSLKRRRCVIPALGWYEWQELPSGNLPWYLHGSKSSLLAFAGIWDHWEGDDEVIESCSIIVGPANNAFMPIHDRMPFVLSHDQSEKWLTRSMTSADKALEVLQPNPDDLIAFHRIGPRVSNARNQGPELIEPINDLK